MAEQYIKEGKHTIKWTRLTYLKFRHGEACPRLHAPAYGLAKVMWKVPDELFGQTLMDWAI